MGSAAVELVVQADDFGMCHAVNEGVVRSVTDGIVTQVTSMAPAPWFDEAARLAADLDVPFGLHQTLTCEWDNLRWRPLTGGATLRAEDGTFHRTVAAAHAALDADEALAELTAQADRARSCGMRVDYLDMHMGTFVAEAYAALCEKLDVPFLYPGLATSLEFDSITMLSARAADRKTAWLVGYIERLEPGRHLLVTHPGVGGAELAALTSPTDAAFPWAEDYRVSDLAALCDPEVRRLIDDRGIALAAV